VTIIALNYPLVSKNISKQKSERKERKMKSSFYRLGLCLVLFCSAFIQTVLPHILKGEEDVLEN